MNKWRFDFAAALAAGVIILFLGALMGQYVEVLWPEHDFEYWMHRYQTVVVSFVAIVGLVGVSNQIKATQRQTKAALMTAHKPEFGALVLVQDIMKRLTQHVDFALNFARAHGVAGAPPRAPQVDADDVVFIRRALSMAGADPFGMTWIHETWTSALTMYYGGTMQLADLEATADFVRISAQETANQSERMVETLHAQIEASV